MDNLETYRKAGYTHIISWKEKSDFLDLYVDKSFPTTSDIVQSHLKSLYTQQMKSHKDIIVIDMRVL